MHGNVAGWPQASSSAASVTMKQMRSPLFIEIGVRIVLLVTFCLLEQAKPLQRSIKHEELWHYKNPFSPDTVSTPVVLCVSVGLPSAFIIVHYLTTADRSDLLQAFLGLSLSALLTAIIIDTLKVAIGRPRPDFYYRCFPNGVATFDLQCSGDPAAEEEGRKSFPSGHSGWIFACFGFLSLYLSGKLQCFRPAGRGQAWRLCAAVVVPLLAASVVGISRIQDHKHHWEDVLVGGGIGLLVSTVCYHQHYPSPLSPNCDSPHPSILDSTAITPSLPISMSRTNLRKAKYTGTPDPHKCSDQEHVS